MNQHILLETLKTCKFINFARSRLDVSIERKTQNKTIKNKTILNTDMTISQITSL